MDKQLLPEELLDDLFKHTFERYPPPDTYQIFYLQPPPWPDPQYQIPGLSLLLVLLTMPPPPFEAMPPPFISQPPLLPYHLRTLSSLGTLAAPLTSPPALTQPPVYQQYELLKPKICTTFWEDAGTTCFQIRHEGILVSRREDNNYINGTKLLNVIGMTRGKRDGILKTEKKKDVVKVGLINLKGVWIPFERAYELARNEGVDAVLHPLFVGDIRGYYETEGRQMKCEETEKPPPRRLPGRRKQRDEYGW